MAQAFALLGMAMTSCTDQDYKELDKGSEELKLSASATEVTLEESAHASTAVEFSWTTGTNHGTGNRISYTLELAEAGTAFADPYIAREDVLQSYSWNPTVEQLNGILIDRLGARPGIPFDLEARITATVAGENEPQVATLGMVVTPYQPVTEELFIIGSATPNGWSADNSQVMTRTDNGIFTWTGNLTEGEFKFIIKKGEFVPAYCNNGEGGLVYRATLDDPDLNFEFKQSGTFRIDVNLLTLTMTITESQGEAPEFTEMYLVGNMTDWNFVAMEQDPLDPFIFKLGYYFDRGGEFKFGTASGSWENMFKATFANAPYTSQEMDFVNGFDPDNKWFLNDDEINRTYRIAVDQRPGQQRMLMTPFEPYGEMYLVGSATPNGWDLGNATPMTQDAANPNVFTWTGHLGEGELKFSCDRKSDWNGAWFLAPVNNAEPTGEPQTAIFIDKSDDWYSKMYTQISVGDTDLKWNIKEAGNYTITLDQLHDKVTITRQ